MGGGPECYSAVLIRRTIAGGGFNEIDGNHKKQKLVIMFVCVCVCAGDADSMEGAGTKVTSWKEWKVKQKMGNVRCMYP